MDDIKGWWEISQLAGAGAALVLGPVCVALWRRVTADTNYIRESDKNNIKVLGELTSVLTHGIASAQEQHGAILRAVNESVIHLKEAISDGHRSTRR